MTREENQNKIIKELYEGELVDGILEMARIGFIPPEDSKGVEIYVHTDDPGKIPHFHVRKRNSSGRGWEFDICVKFEECDYFPHGRHKGKLDPKVIKDMDKMLRSVGKDESETYWKIAVTEWNRNNSDVKLDKNIVQPDYNELRFKKGTK